MEATPKGSNTADEKQSDLDDIIAERRSVQRQFRFAAMLAAGVLFIGAVFYHAMLHLSWLNAVYFCTITLTTIGYGDITPTTAATRLFTIFYALAGVGIIGFFINITSRNAVIRREMRRARHHAKDR